MTTRLAVCQYAIDIDDPDGTRTRLVASVQEAADAGAQVIVLREHCTSGYVFRDLDECWSVPSRPTDSRSSPYPSSSSRSTRSASAALCGCQVRDRPFSSAAVVENGEVLTLYRKAHL